MTDKFQVQAAIQRNQRLTHEYFQLDLAAPAIASSARPGQFIHLQLPDLPHRVLRRPFSIYDLDPASGRLSILYKVVGQGTVHLSQLAAGTSVDLLGPLGNGFTSFTGSSPGVIVAGGYGCAATYLLAKHANLPPIVLIGGRSQQDVLLRQEFTDLRCDLRIATDDGSEGHHGLVTELLPPLLNNNHRPEIAACGPTPMLKAVAEIVAKHQHDAELSMEQQMCCGVGACFACVIKHQAETPEQWTYTRVCSEGPVFKASQIVWN